MSPHARFEKADWSVVPDYLHHQLERWLVDGIRPPKSRFLYAVLCNDLATAVTVGNHIERAALVAIVVFLSYECSLPCWGSPGKCTEWEKLGGWRGMREMTERMGESYE
jgi:hypothetical protein